LTHIQEILPLDSGGILSLTGAGGKTTLMFHLAHLLAREGMQVLTTTTTKIFFPSPSQGNTTIVSDSVDEVIKQAKTLLQDRNHITAASVRIESGEKLKGFSSKQIQDIQQTDLFDWIIVEADGAARRPLKAPADHEPVIPENTTIWMGVAGLDVIHKPLTETHVFRPELISQRIGLRLGDPILEHHVAALLIHPQGYLKGVPTKSHHCIFLNKADTPENVDSGNKIVDHVRQMGTGNLHAIIIGQAKDSLIIHDWVSFQ
jgi:probable selenium-dependent hydroxylase accessory protein YqeC